MDDGYTKQYIVYAGKRITRDGSLEYRFYKLNDDFKIMSLGMNYGKKLFTKAAIGLIFEANFKGGSISYNSKRLPMEYVQLVEGGPHIYSKMLFKEERVEWESLDRVATNVIKDKKTIDKYGVSLILNKLRLAYKKCNTRQEQSMFLANIIQKVTR